MGFFESVILLWHTLWNIFWFVLAVALGYKVWKGMEAIHELNRTVQLMAYDIKDLRKDLRKENAVAAPDQEAK